VEIDLYKKQECEEVYRLLEKEILKRLAQKAKLEGIARRGCVQEMCGYQEHFKICYLRGGSAMRRLMGDSLRRTGKEKVIIGW